MTACAASGCTRERAPGGALIADRRSLIVVESRSAMRNQCMVTED
jgi:hypothetical protein